MSDVDRETMFANERLLIGMLQAVSGASVVASISQWEALVKHASVYGVLIFISAMALALMLAVVAAYLKHEYKKWDVKAQVSRSQVRLTYDPLEKQKNVRHEEDVTERSALAECYLNRMRRAMLLATALILAAVAELVVFLWLSYFGSLGG